MPRAKGAPSRRKRKKLQKLAKGFRGGRRTLHKAKREAVTRALAHAKRDRRYKKRDFRRLWIARVNAGARGAGLTYSAFISGLRRAGVGLDRRALSELAIRDPKAFSELVSIAKAA